MMSIRLCIALLVLLVAVASPVSSCLDWGLNGGSDPKVKPTSFSPDVSISFKFHHIFHWQLILSSFNRIANLEANRVTGLLLDTIVMTPSAKRMEENVKEELPIAAGVSHLLLLHHHHLAVLHRHPSPSLGRSTRSRTPLDANSNTPTPLNKLSLHYF